MATKVTAMKPTGLSRMHKLISSVPGRIGLVVLTTVVVVGVVPLIFFFNQVIIPAVLKFIAVAGIGIVSGFAARRLLRTNTRLLIMLTAFIAVYVGLWLLNILTAGYIGIQPFHFRSSGPDWLELVQLALGTMVAWLALQAWRNPVRIGRITAAPAGKRKRPPSTSQSGKKKANQATKRKRKLTRSATSRTKKRSLPEVQLPSLAQRPYWAQSNYWVDKWVNMRAGVQASWMKLYAIMRQPVYRANQLLSRPRLKTISSQKSIQLRTRKPKVNTPKRTRTCVRFSGAVEHRCPFCLEPVELNDPRGVKACPICHTHHHTDCWEVTGACQIPHLHE